MHTPKSFDAHTVVTVRRSLWLSVTLTDEFIGVFSFASFLPQYLIRAMFVGEDIVVTCIWLEDANLRDETLQERVGFLRYPSF